jgi:predicted phosphodiesterase
MIHTETAPQKAIKFFALGCSHAPLMDPHARQAIREKIAEFDPDVIIHLGDIFEADAASRWENEYSWTLKEEFREADSDLWAIRNASPRPLDVRCVLLPGNHDDNLLTWNRINRKLRDTCDWTLPHYMRVNGKQCQINREMLTHWERPHQYRYEKKSCFRIGAVTFGHGWECGVSSDEAQSLYLAWPQGLFVSAHTHRPTPGPARQAMKTKSLPLDRYYLNAGCTRELECHYMERKRQMMWGHGCVYGWSLPINSPRFTPTWDAHCEVFRIFD